MSISYLRGASPTEVAVKLKAAAARARNLRPVLIPISNAVKKLMTDSFQKSNTPEGIQWKPLSAATLLHKRGPRIGIETGRLLASVYAFPEGNGVRYGASAPYAAAFNLGATRTGTLAYPSPGRPAGAPWNIIQPARPFVPTGASGESKKIFQLIGNWIGTYISTGKKP